MQAVILLNAGAHTVVPYVSEMVAVITESVAWACSVQIVGHLFSSLQELILPWFAETT